MGVEEPKYRVEIGGEITLHQRIVGTPGPGCMIETTTVQTNHEGEIVKTTVDRAVIEDHGGIWYYRDLQGDD